MRRLNAKILVPAALVAALLAGCTATADAADSTDSSRRTVTTTSDANVTVEQAMAANTAPDDVDLTASDDEVAIDLDAPAAADGVTVDGSTLTITAAGTYRLSGTLADGSVVVNTTDDGVVHLILDDASIGSSTTSPLQVLDADQVVVHLEGENVLTDTTAYADTDEASAALFSSADLTITGDGLPDGGRQRQRRDRREGRPRHRGRHDHGRCGRRRDPRQGLPGGHRRHARHHGRRRRSEVRQRRGRDPRLRRDHGRFRGRHRR